MTTVLAAFILLVGPATIPVSAAQSQPLNLALQGMITNAGSQVYVLNGGQLVGGYAFSTQLSSSANVNYAIAANVAGLKTMGGGIITVTDGSQGRFNMLATVVINGEAPAGVFPLKNIGTPLNPNYVNCDPTKSACNSEIPLLFTGTATIVTISGSSVQRTTLPIGIESAYWNPFGGPIAIVSLDSTTAPSILLIVTYKVATIGWTGVQLQGLFGGTLGTQTASGSYVTVSNSHEDLVAGKEQDYMGTMTFANSVPAVLNGVGQLSGTTTIPAETPQNSFDCSSTFGLPEGTCVATGAISSGSFHMISAQNARIDGTYSTIWSVPSLFTATTVVGAVSQQ